MSQTEVLGRELQELAQFSVEASVIEQAIARKALLQAGLLGFDQGMQAVESPTGAEQIGVFQVLPTTAEINWSTPSGDLHLNPGDVYLDFHMPRTSEGLSIDGATESYKKIAKYIKDHKEIEHIFSVTYRIMAISAKQNHGFNMEEIQLPDTVMSYLSAYWQDMMPEAKPAHFERAFALWQARDDFIELYS